MPKSISKLKQRLTLEVNGEVCPNNTQSNIQVTNNLSDSARELFNDLLDELNEIDTKIIKMETILMGDFNCEPDSREFARLTGRSNPDMESEANGAAFADAWAAAGHHPMDLITWSPYPGAIPEREARLD